MKKILVGFIMDGHGGGVDNYLLNFLKNVNSNDVQIEIKVRMNGYRDQTRRFNVRQAIDQQEISSFFDMIKIEE